MSSPFRSKDNNSGNQAKVWYFAYGPDLNVELMKKRIGSWQLSKRALTRNYRLVFNRRKNSGTALKGSKPQKKADSGEQNVLANLEETGRFEDTVHGVVYRITPDQLAALQKIEAIAPIELKVELEDGNEISHARAFVEKKSSEKTKEEGVPSKEYRHQMDEGFLEHGYDESIPKAIFARFDSIH